MDYAVKVRLFWWDNDQFPADHIAKSEKAAEEWAVERSKMVQGKVELYAGPNMPAYATYKNGERIQFAPHMMPSAISNPQQMSMAQPQMSMVDETPYQETQA